MKSAKGDDYISKSHIRILSVLLAVLIMFSGGISAYAFSFPFETPIESQNEQVRQEDEKIAAAMHKPISRAQGFTLTADKITTGSAELNWKSDKLILSYLVCKYNVITNAWEEYTTTNSNTLFLNNLDEDADYRFGIFNGVTMEGLAEVSFTTGIKSASVAVTKCSSDSIVLRIRHIESVTKVLLYRSEDGVNFDKIAEVGDGQYIDKNVKESTKYYYRVICVTNRAGRKNSGKASRTAEAVTLKNFDLPDITGATKTYAFYNAVTLKSSPQYALLNSDKCYTDEETGIRMVDGYYCIALGSFYGSKIGTKYRITLKDGDQLKELNCILCDQKADKHTDKNHQYAVQNNDIMEFYIQKNKLPHGIVGNYGNLEQFRGDIVKIEQYPDTDAPIIQK